MYFELSKEEEACVLSGVDVFVLIVFIISIAAASPSGPFRKSAERLWAAREFVTPTSIGRCLFPQL